MMPPTRALPSLLALLGALSACGGQTIRVPDDQRAAAGDESGGEEAEAGEDAEAGDGEDEDPPRDIGPVVLGDPVGVPGTGVTLRVPRGATRAPFVAGFVDERRRLRVAVVVARGPESVLEEMRAAAGGGANPTPEEVRRVRVSGQSGRLGYDILRTSEGNLERTWLLVHDGERGLAVIVTYEESQAERVRAVAMESLETLEWDRSEPIDAGRALGIQVGPVEGLEPSQASSVVIVHLPPDATFPPEPGEAMVRVLPLPFRVPQDQQEEACDQLIARFMDLNQAAVAHEGPVDDGELPGCERLATIETNEGDEIGVYAAVLFHQGWPIVLTATVAGDELSTWQGRFLAAARTVRVPTP